MRYPKTVADGLMYDADLYEHTENNDNYINYTYINSSRFKTSLLYQCLAVEGEVTVPREVRVIFIFLRKCGWLWRPTLRSELRDITTTD